LVVVNSENQYTNESTKSTTRKPNILLILADDVGTGDIPGYWNTSLHIDMPNIAQLVEKGTIFTDAHSTPLCATSRYLLLSGNYQYRGYDFRGKWGLDYESGQFQRGQKSIADVLREGGNYHTFMAGKWHLGGNTHFLSYLSFVFSL
jgi:arylsulfatase A-like enzyme